jgi:DNA-binding transcriptional LysR family regulator
MHDIVIMLSMHDLPDLDLLRCFATLHRERHLTRAAVAVGLSQPAMSRALGRMRDAFADPLFVRGPRGMLPTPRADALVPQVLAVLDAAGALVRPAAFDPATLARAFTIGTTDFFDAELVPHLVEGLASAPGVSIITRPLGEDVDDALATGRLDLAIGVADNAPPGAMTARLFDDGFTCAVRADHPGVGKRLTLARYLELPHLLIAPRGLPGGTVDDALAKQGVVRRIVVRTHTFVSAPAIVASSDLILTGPTRVLAPLAGPFRLRLLPPPLELGRFAIWQIWHPRVQRDPAHAWFRGLVAAAARR